MTTGLALYSAATWALEPLAKPVLQARTRKGKERADRVAERWGRATIQRPPGALVWMHAASVGESRLLLDLFEPICARRADISAVLTTQTLTSADMIAERKPLGVVHQMAPIDAPRAVDRFLQHWRPNAAVFAEGEIWPNLLLALNRRQIPAALVNARMTARSLASWRRWSGAARQLFGTFAFIGAADQATAQGLASIRGRAVDVVGNLKRASRVAPPDQAAVKAWRTAIGDRPVLLAASTHPGEDEFALAAFTAVRAQSSNALLVIAPRHPVRGPDIAKLAKQAGFTTQLRTEDASTPGPAVDVLVADTMGELIFWYAASDAIYLGGATAADVGGHNPIEPAQLGKRVFTGPHGFNFAEVFEDLAAIGAVRIRSTPEELAQYWLAELRTETPAAAPALTAFLQNGRAPFDATLEAVLALLPSQAPATPHA